MNQSEIIVGRTSNGKVLLTYRNNNIVTDFEMNKETVKWIIVELARSIDLKIEIKEN